MDDRFAAWIMQTQAWSSKDRHPGGSGQVGISRAISMHKATR